MTTIPPCGTFASPNPDDLRNSATNRAFDSFLRTVGRETTKVNKQDAERLKAMANTLPRLFDNMPEDALAGLFFALETAATAANRRRIASHPKRPAEVDDLHAEAQAEAAAEAEAAGQRPSKDPAAKSAEAVKDETPGA